MADAPSISSELQALLEAAGYVRDEQAGDWVHPATRRCLDGGIARQMSREQIVEWIKAGTGRAVPDDPVK